MSNALVISQAGNGDGAAPKHNMTCVLVKTMDRLGAVATPYFCDAELSFMVPLLLYVLFTDGCNDALIRVQWQWIL